MRKVVKKHHVVKKRKSAKKSLPFVSFRTLIIGISVLLLVIGLNNFRANVHVLGVNTGPAPLLADKGSDDSGSSGGGSHESGGGGGSNSGGGSGGGSGSNGGGDSGRSGGDRPSGGAPSGTVSHDTQVDCVGPNGVHFVTSFHDCQEFNQKWNNAGFRFTPLANPQVKQETEQEKPEVEQEKEASAPAHEALRVETEGRKGEINLATQGLQIQVKREDDGSVHLKAKKADGTEVELETNALDQLNEELKDKEVEVASSSSTVNALVLRRKGVEAETELPISVDPNTHELTVTTPAGVRTVTILPDQAVNNLLTNKVLTSVETQVSSGSGAVSQVSTLTQLNNQPVFAVNGITQKNLLGLFPIGFAKTAFVSAANGNVVQVNEALFNRILEALSF